MYTFDWLPSSEQTKAKFQGKVVVRVPSHLDRVQRLQKIHTRVDNNGELTSSQSSDNAIAMIEWAASQIESVALTRLDDKADIKEVNWLMYDIDGAEVLKEIGLKLFQGVKLGKN